MNTDDGTKQFALQPDSHAAAPVPDTPTVTAEARDVAKTDSSVNGDISVRAAEGDSGAGDQVATLATLPQASATAGQGAHDIAAGKRSEAVPSTDQTPLAAAQNGGAGESDAAVPAATETASATASDAKVDDSNHDAPSLSSAPASAAVHPTSSAQSAAHAKKFTSLNVNKRFLEKAGPSPGATSPTPTKLGGAASPLSTGPSLARLSSPSSASRLTSAKLSSAPKPQPAGWATKTAPAAVKMSPTLSTGSATAATAPAPAPPPAAAGSSASESLAPVVPSPSSVSAAPSPKPTLSTGIVSAGNATQGTASPRLVTMARESSPRPLSAGLDSGSMQGRASPGLRNAALGASGVRAASPASVSKAPWANVKPTTASSLGATRRPGSMLSDFPTAAEAAKAKEEQEAKAAAAAAREAARQQAALQNLDRFRGTALGSGKHWDEMEDEDLGEVVEFADGTQYKIPTHADDKGDGHGSGPVSKEDRFRDVSHDRSWPPRGPEVNAQDRPSRAAAAPPPAWGPQRARETATQTSHDAPATGRSHGKPEKVIIPLSGTSVSLRSPTEAREPSYGYPSRERRPMPSYSQASHRQEAAGAAPPASAESATRAARAWGPLAQRQASLNPGAAPPPPPPAAVQSAPRAPQAGTIGTGGPASAKFSSGTAATPAASSGSLHEDPAAEAPPSVPSVAAPQPPPMANGASVPARSALPQAAARGPTHLNRPLPPHLANRAAAVTPDDSTVVRGRTSFSPPQPDSRPAAKADSVLSAVSATRPPWGPRAAHRDAAAEGSDRNAVRGSDGGDLAAAPDTKAEMQSSIERARKRREEEEAARQAEKERARQKALAIEERLKAEAAQKVADQNRRSAEEERAKARQAQANQAQGQDQFAGSPEAAARSGPAASAASWRSARGHPDAAKQSRSELQQSQAGSAPMASAPQGDLWRPRAWRSQRPENEPQPALSQHRSGDTGPAHDQRQQPLSMHQQHRETPPSVHAGAADASSFSRKLPPHLVSSSQMAGRAEPPHLRQQAAAPEREERAAASWRARREGEAIASGPVRASASAGRGELEVAADSTRRSPQARAILAPARQQPATQNAPAAHATSPELVRRSPEQHRAIRDGAATAASEQPKVILARSGARQDGERAQAPLTSGHRGDGRPESGEAQPARSTGSNRERRTKQSEASGVESNQASDKPGASNAKPKPAVPQVPTEKPTTREEVAADRPPVWNRFTVSIRPAPAQPKLNRSQQKAQATRIASMSQPVRPVYPLTWEPPMTHLSIKTLSRDDQFFPKKYQRGTVITPVSLPTARLPRGLPAIVFPTPAPNDKLSAGSVRKQARFDTSLVQPVGAPSVPRGSALQAPAPPSALSNANGTSSQAKPQLGSSAIQVRLPGHGGPLAGTAPGGLGAAAPADQSSLASSFASQPHRDLNSASAASFTGPHVKAGIRSPFRAALSAATAQSSLGPLDHPNSSVEGSNVPSYNGSLTGQHGSGFRNAQRRSSNTPVAFYDERQINTPSPVSFMVNSELKSTDGGSSGVGAAGLSPYVIGGSGRSSNSQTPGTQQNSMLPSPNLATTATWGQSSLTFPVIEPHSSNNADRDHIKNVWSLPTGNDRKETQNSLRDIGDDFLPSAMPLSVHDFRAEAPAAAHDANETGGRVGARNEASFNRYAPRYEGTTAEAAAKPVDLSSVGSRANGGFDPTTRSPSLDIASPSVTHRAHNQTGTHSHGSTPQHRSASSLMPLQSGGHALSSPTLQHFGGSGAASTLRNHDRNAPQADQATSAAAAAAAAARNAFGAYGGYTQNQSSLAAAGGSPNLQSSYGNGASTAGVHGRTPFGAYSAHGSVNSAPVSPYNGISRLSAPQSQGSAHTTHGNAGGYSLFPTSPQGGRGDSGSVSGTAPTVAGLGVLDPSALGSDPIGYGRAAHNHQGRVLQGQQHGQHQFHPQQQQPQQYQQPGQQVHAHAGGQGASEDPYAGYGSSGRWTAGVQMAGAGYSHPTQSSGARGYHPSRQHAQGASAANASHGRHQHHQQAQHHHQQQQHQLSHHHHQQQQQQQQQNAYPGGQTYVTYGSAAFDPTSHLW